MTRDTIFTAAVVLAIAAFAGVMVALDDPAGRQARYDADTAAVAAAVEVVGADGKEFTVTDVARTLGVSVKTASRRVGRLVEGGKVERIHRYGWTMNTTTYRVVN